MQAKSVEEASCHQNQEYLSLIRVCLTVQAGTDTAFSELQKLIKVDQSCIKVFVTVELPVTDTTDRIVCLLLNSKHTCLAAL
jgi:hypothetical protein